MFEEGRERREKKGREGKRNKRRQSFHFITYSTRERRVVSFSGGKLSG